MALAPVDSIPFRSIPAFISTPAENAVTHTAKHDALQAAAISEPQDQDYECCECFGTFEDDIALGNQAEWAMCVCGKWLHEDCVSETVVDANGRLRMCSSCVVYPLLLDCICVNNYCGFNDFMFLIFFKNTCILLDCFNTGKM